MANFHCKSFDLDMPAENQRGFCALRYRSGKMICTECKTGKAAAKEDAADVRAGLPETQKEIRVKAQNSRRELEKYGQEEGTMAEKELCSCGKCGSKAVKEGLSYKCYKAKHGRSPWGKDKPKNGKVLKGPRKAAAKKSGPKRSALPGVVVIAPENLESVKVLSTLISLGIVSEAQVTATRKYVREMFGG